MDVLSVPNKAGGGPFLCYNGRIQPADSHHLTHFACGGVGKHEPSGGAGDFDGVDACNEAGIYDEVGDCDEADNDG